MASVMNRLFKLQFLGPLALFATTLCAELAARALQYAPSSELLWFINLRIFGIFQRSHALLSWIVAIDGFQFFGVVLPIFLLACFGLAAKSRLPFTVATHLSAVCAGFLVLAWQAGVPTPHVAVRRVLARTSWRPFSERASCLSRSRICSISASCDRK